MVSFWPWRSDPSSPASFEKELSALSENITKSQDRLDKLRSRSRRVLGLVTIYSVLGYLICAAVELLVIGQQNMGPLEWTALAGSPVAIYVTRYLVRGYFNYRIDTVTTRLQTQLEEREKTIQKLKDATKYDSTLELLEKYGGGRKTENPDEDGGSRPASRQSSVGLGMQGVQASHRQPYQQGRVSMAPPPTANIQSYRERPTTPSLEPSAEFAPNAEFSPAQEQGLPAGPSGPFPRSLHGKPTLRRTGTNPQFTQYHHDPSANGPAWYDRFLDLILGEDEMAPKNRIALICEGCRLVNGQAPPGTKRLAEVGVWKCMGCGSMNGEEKVDEGKKIVREVIEEKKKGNTIPKVIVGGGGSEDEDSDDEEGDEDEDEDEEEEVLVKVKKEGNNTQ